MILFSDLFGLSGQDTAVIVSAIIGMIAVALKVVPQKTSKEAEPHRCPQEIEDLKLRFVKVESAVQIVQFFLFGRSISEVVNTGNGVANSPLQISPEAAMWFDSMKDDLQSWYKKATESKNNQMDIWSWLTARFGSRILNEVALPKKIPFGSCLVVAFAVAQDNLTIDVPEGVISQTSLPENTIPEPPK